MTLSTLAALALLVSGVSACKRSLPEPSPAALADFEGRWRDLILARTADEEALRMGALVRVYRDEPVSFSLEVTDARTGKAYAVNELPHLGQRPLAVTLTLQKRDLPAWRPRNVSNIFPLLRE